MPSRDDRDRGTSHSSQCWSTFVRNHAKASIATNLLTVVTARFQFLYVLVVMEVGTRKMTHVNVTTHPTAEWTLQQFQRRYRASTSLSRCRRSICVDCCVNGVTTTIARGRIRLSEQMFPSRRALFMSILLPIVTRFRAESESSQGPFLAASITITLQSDAPESLQPHLPSHSLRHLPAGAG